MIEHSPETMPFLNPSTGRYFNVTLLFEAI